MRSAQRTILKFERRHRPGDGIKAGGSEKREAQGVGSVVDDELHSTIRSRG
jgi:hypothetical protein